MQLADFDFALPPSLIAQFPPAERGASRLLEVDPPPSVSLRDRVFRDLPSLLAPGDLLVVNDTRVIKARLLGVKADSGGQVEALIERVTDTFTALVQMRASKTPRDGTRLSWRAGATTGADAGARVVGRAGSFFLLAFDEPVLDVLERCGHTPLPPYITHAPQTDDEQRYQTVYAREPGAVAAPTAGLHFDDALFDALRQRGIERAELTLHVGAGTFQPVRVDDLSQHRMHVEHFSVPESTVEAIARTRARGGRVVAVGTTTLRALESAAVEDGQVRAGAGHTQLFITPGYRFRVVDRLITNFHLPRSTLLMLVSAFAGVETIRAAYAHAIAERYRFFSYGDAMLLSRQEPTGC
ncbi:MAG: tRNA preQ1(34) S-adenosylmethionine ribosyltransferase-isomerase QueA [Burkholderiaceae bacterium]